MAINKNSTAFTFGFAIIMVIVVGAVLAFLSVSLKPAQEKNAADKKMMNILGAVLIETTRDNAQAEFSKYVTERVSIDFEGKVIETRTEALKAKSEDPNDPFYIDSQKLYKNFIKKAVNSNKEQSAYESAMKELSSNPKSNVQYSAFKVEKDGATYWVVPMVGTGLWGPIWGYVSLEGDYKTVYGATFDHKGETPGLGAEIKESFFTDQFGGKELDLNDPKSTYFTVQKAGAGASSSSVDGITGGTITSKGVEEMMNRTFDIYLDYFTNSPKTSDL